MAGVSALACLTVVLLAAAVRPAAAGHGTHEALGLMPCIWGSVLNLPCPTCGMTTAFALLAEGQIGRAFVTQPMGALLGIATAAAFWVGVHVACTGSRLAKAFDRLLLRPATLWIGIAALLAAWGYKVVTWPGT